MLSYHTFSCSAFTSAFVRLYHFGIFYCPIGRPTGFIRSVLSRCSAGAMLVLKPAIPCWMQTKPCIIPMERESKKGHRGQCTIYVCDAYHRCTVCILPVLCLIIYWYQWWQLPRLIRLYRFRRCGWWLWSRSLLLTLRLYSRPFLCSKHLNMYELLTYWPIDLLTYWPIDLLTYDVLLRHNPFCYSALWYYFRSTIPTIKPHPLHTAHLIHPLHPLHLLYTLLFNTHTHYTHYI